MSIQLQEQDKITHLLNELVNGNHSEEVSNMLYDKIDDLVKDPNWSYYIFWSNDYHYEDGSLNHEKFFQKIEEYENSDEYKRNKYIISLVNDLLNKNFDKKSEMDIVNELHKLIPNENWIDCLFVSKSCFLDGVFYEKEFLKSMGLIDFEESGLT